MAKFPSLLPCIPSIPRDNSSSLSISPRPIIVFNTGVSIFFAKSTKSRSLLADFTPPPAYIMGLLLSFINLHASLIFFSLSCSSFKSNSFFEGISKLDGI